MKVRYTVPSDTVRAAYVGNGVTTVFSAPFNFFDNTDLLVVLVVDATAVETTQILTTNYTVTGGNGSTGSITMLVAPPTGTTLVIERNIPFTQEIDLEPNDPFPAEVTEEGFDRATMLAQQNRNEIAKSPKLPATYDPDTDPEIRIPVPEAGKVLVGNEDSDGWENAALEDLDVADVPVTLVSLANRDLLEYESAGATWKNQTLAAVLKRMLTAAGDIAVNIAGTVSRLPAGTALQVLRVNAGATALEWAAAPNTTGPTVQNFTSGTAATYTTPAGVRWIKVRMVAGGGGGGGVGASTAPTGATGGTTTFNSINANGGVGGTGATGVTIGVGGAGGSGGSGSAALRIAGGNGGDGGFVSAANFAIGGPGGNAPFFGGGGGLKSSSGGAAGNAATANTGGGGSGTGAPGATQSSGGGGSGEYIEIIISNPAATYTYTVGAGGVGGVGTGSGANNGGAGGTGFITVEEHYNF